MRRTIEFSEWQQSRGADRARVEEMNAAFAEPYRRERPRNAAEAAFLRALGTPEQLIGAVAEDDAARLAFAVPPQKGEFKRIDLSLLDPNDDDQLRILIEAEHPELARAIANDEMVLIGDEEMNPRLHLTMHAVIARQLWDDDPPEVWETAKRLTASGYDRHDIIHMLAGALMPRIWGALREGDPGTDADYAERLAVLPGSWEEKSNCLAARGPSKQEQAGRSRKAARAARKANHRR